MASGEDVSEKTSIVSGDTFSGKMKEADQTPPALVVLMGPQGYVGKQWSLTLPEYIIGRAVESSIFLDDKSVSRTHAKLNVVGSEVIIQDLGSSNKTAINSQVLNPLTPHKLKNNDQVKAGNIILKFLERGNMEALANQQLIEKAEKDVLTGAFTKRALLEKGPEAIKRAEFLNEELSILVLDIDFFKKINDGYGHAAGDYVIRQMSLIINSKLIRSHDYYARYGGEEFVLILSGAPQKNAHEVAERIRTTIQGSEFIFEGKQIPVTISIGLATRKPNESNWDELFKRADEALYQSKQNGRNRVTIAP
ncbi:MAG: GGDEF domain-containing protein [Oligoflexia bacterium]|nr:MAG: GGDEF domain-containing protein [Oligoflexia bacterium]